MGVVIPNMAKALSLRGKALDNLAYYLTCLRMEGKACYRCTRLLSPGGVCPDHPRAGPPRYRKPRPA